MIQKKWFFLFLLTACSKMIAGEHSQPHIGCNLKQVYGKQDSPLHKQPQRTRRLSPRPGDRLPDEPAATSVSLLGERRTTLVALADTGKR